MKGRKAQSDTKQYVSFVHNSHDSSVHFGPTHFPFEIWLTSTPVLRRLCTFLRKCQINRCKPTPLPLTVWSFTFSTNHKRVIKEEQLIKVNEANWKDELWQRTNSNKAGQIIENGYWTSVDQSWLLGLIWLHLWEEHTGKASLVLLDEAQRGTHFDRTKRAPVCNSVNSTEQLNMERDIA